MDKCKAGKTTEIDSAIDMYPKTLKYIPFAKNDMPTIEIKTKYKSLYFLNFLNSIFSL